MSETTAPTIPQLAAVMPLRYVPSVDQLRTYYLEQLGFEHMMGIVGADGQLDFAIVHLNGAGLMLSRPQTQTPDGLTRGPLEIYIAVSGVDAFAAGLQSRGVALTQPLTTNGGATAISPLPIRSVI
jgi:hypothetical protein